MESVEQGAPGDAGVKTVKRMRAKQSDSDCRLSSIKRGQPLWMRELSTAGSTACQQIDDYWNIDGSRDLSDSWTGFTQVTLLSEKPPEGYLWSVVRLTKRQATSRPDH